MGSLWMRSQLAVPHYMKLFFRRTFQPATKQAARWRRSIVDMFSRRPKLRRRGHVADPKKQARAEARHAAVIEKHNLRMDRFCKFFNGSPFSKRITHHCSLDCEMECKDSDDCPEKAVTEARTEILGQRIPKCSDKEFTSVGQGIMCKQR